MTITTKLHALNIPNIDPISILAGFIIGSVVADGDVDEREYILIYPSLVKAFGDDFDFASIKASFRKDSDGRKKISEYTKKMLGVLDILDDGLKEDIITLCLCVVAIDGKVSFKEKNYIKRLCMA